MKEINESNFADVQKSKNALVFFYREKGCSFCDQMKPVIERYENERPQVDVYWYKLGAQPDSITKDLVQRFPTMVAFVDGQMVGKKEGVKSIEELDRINEPDVVPVEKASLEQLMKDEQMLIDQIAPIKEHLLRIRAEVKRRRDLVGL